MCAVSFTMRFPTDAVDSLKRFLRAAVDVHVSCIVLEGGRRVMITEERAQAGGESRRGRRP